MLHPKITKNQNPQEKFPITTKIDSLVLVLSMIFIVNLIVKILNLKDNTPLQQQMLL